ncbi:hypothetical protein ElyMa_000081400 [Elysia marginata]|uniref:Uncharacterized protein n=1 Tax=Elysia marginata TaxID=1093978 RepID=A0AAV4EJ57_9GAST|nr:hypothetical protein ElyMa_000081400 [Elysia marginata]
MADAPPANCGVQDADKKLVYDRAADDLKDLKKKDFQFTINSGGAQDTATFEMVKNGEVIRRHQSSPYPAGALKLDSISVNADSCVVKLKKLKDINLNDYFCN